MPANQKPRPGIPSTLLTWGCLFVLYIPPMYILFLARDYGLALQDPLLIRAMLLSIGIGFLASLFATILGTLAAFGLERLRFAGRSWCEMLILTPLVVPDLVLGLSLLAWFVILKLPLGWKTVVMSHITLCLAYVVVVVRARLADFNLALEDAARDLGATGAQVFFRVTLPLLRPAIIAGALMAFTVSFDDFIIAFFTTGVGDDTLPVRIYSLIKFGVHPELYALSTMVLFVTLVATSVAIWIEGAKR